MASSGSVRLRINGDLEEIVFKPSNDQEIHCKENDEIAIENDSDLPVFVQCDGARDRHTGAQVEAEDGEIRVPPGHSYLLSSPEDEHVFLTSGLHTIKSSDGEFVYLSVDYSTDLSKPGIEAIVSALEELQSNLSLDFSSLGESVPTEEQVVKSILDEYTPKLDRCVFGILNEFSASFRTEYVKSEAVGKQDSHSVRLNSKIAARGGEYVSVKKSFTFDTLENRVLKKVASILLFRLRSLLSDTQNALLKFESTGLNTREAVAKSIISSCEKCIPLISQLLASQELSSIEGTYSVPRNLVTFRQDYRTIFDFCSDLINLRSKATTGFKQRRNSKLFELYGLVIIDRALRLSGFTRERDTATDVSEYDLNGVSLAYGSPIGKAIVRYDESIPHFTKVDTKTRKTGSLVYYLTDGEDKDTQNSETSRRGTDHLTPDYTIELFDNNGRFLYSIVIDMKYRDFIKLVGPDGIPDKGEEVKLKKTNDLTATIQDYLSFGYVSPKHRLRPGAVDSLFYFYPDKKQSVYTSYFHAVKFVGVNPKVKDSKQSCVALLSREIASIFKGTNFDL